MTEETHNAAVAGPKGIVRSIWVSLIAGFVLLVGITYAIPTTAEYTKALTSATGVPPVQIWIDAIGRHGGEWLLVVAMVAQAYCGMASVTANSRMIYAFSRDGAIPGSKFWHHINPRTRTPSRAIYFAVVFAFILAIPSMWSSVAYGAVISIAVIGLYIAYVIPTLLRRLAGDSFKPGPWNLGKWSAVVGWVGIIWVGIITILFVLPTASPITWHNFNYTIVAVGVVLLYASDLLVRERPQVVHRAARPGRRGRPRGHREQPQAPPSSSSPPSESPVTTRPEPDERTDRDRVPVAAPARVGRRVPRDGPAHLGAGPDDAGLRGLQELRGRRRGAGVDRHLRQSMETHRAWRDHPEHRAAQQMGRDRFYASYDITVCEVIGESHFPGR